MKLDILAFGAHPDDVELACSGTLMVEKNRGKKIGIVDLTQGELGSRGSVELRYKESETASTIMGIDVRENLKMKDGFFVHNEEHILKVVQSIRKYQPEIVFANAPEDRHPDHGKGSHLVYDAFFLAGLSKVETFLDNKPQMPWRPCFLFYYIQDRLLTPHFFIDITDYWDKKMKSIYAYSSQFHIPNITPTSDEPRTYISSEGFLESWEARHRTWGKNIGVKYAEGFISVRNLGMNSLDFLIQTPY